MNPALTIAELPFYEAPSDIEGSPYWVDLWAHVNGYRIGLQVKPSTFRAASMSIYTGKGKSSQMKGHRLFREHFGGKVIIANPQAGIVETRTCDEVVAEIARLNQLPPGELSALPD